MNKEAVAVTGGVTLGFGGAGVLVALEEMGLLDSKNGDQKKIGASSGALVVAGYVAGLDLRETIMKISQFNFFRDFVGNPLHILKRGSVASEELLRKELGQIFDKDLQIEELPGILISVTDKDKKRIILDGGNLIDALLVSISWDHIFPKIQVDGKCYGDGELDRSWPVEELRDFNLIGIRRMNGRVLAGADKLAALILYRTYGNRFAFGHIEADFCDAYKAAYSDRDKIMASLRD